MLEAQIQAAIVEDLRKKGFYCFSIPNEQAHGNAVRTGQLLTMGMKPGVADLEVWYGKQKTAFIEVKTPKNTQQPNQIEFERNCKNWGYPYRVVRSVQEAEEFINDCLRSNDT